MSQMVGFAALLSLSTSSVEALETSTQRESFVDGALAEINAGRGAELSAALTDYVGSSVRGQMADGKDGVRVAMNQSKAQSTALQSGLGEAIASVFDPAQRQEQLGYYRLEQSRRDAGASTVNFADTEARLRKALAALLRKVKKSVGSDWPAETDIAAWESDRLKGASNMKSALAKLLGGNTQETLAALDRLGSARGETDDLTSVDPHSHLNALLAKAGVSTGDSLHLMTDLMAASSGSMIGQALVDGETYRDTLAGGQKALAEDYIAAMNAKSEGEGAFDAFGKVPQAFASRSPSGEPDPLMSQSPSDEVRAGEHSDLPRQAAPPPRVAQHSNLAPASVDQPHALPSTPAPAPVPSVRGAAPTQAADPPKQESTPAPAPSKRGGQGSGLLSDSDFVDPSAPHDVSGSSGSGSGSGPRQDALTGGSSRNSPSSGGSSASGGGSSSAGGGSFVPSQPSPPSAEDQVCMVDPEISKAIAEGLKAGADTSPWKSVSHAMDLARKGSQFGPKALQKNRAAEVFGYRAPKSFGAKSFCEITVAYAKTKVSGAEVVPLVLQSTENCIAAVQANNNRIPLSRQLFETYVPPIEVFYRGLGGPKTHLNEDAAQKARPVLARNYLNVLNQAMSYNLKEGGGCTEAPNACPVFKGLAEGNLSPNGRLLTTVLLKTVAAYSDDLFYFDKPTSRSLGSYYVYNSQGKDLEVKSGPSKVSLYKAIWNDFRFDHSAMTNRERKDPNMVRFQKLAECQGDASYSRLVAAMVQAHRIVAQSCNKSGGDKKPADLPFETLNESAMARLVVDIRASQLPEGVGQLGPQHCESVNQRLMTLESMLDASCQHVNTNVDVTNDFAKKLRAYCSDEVARPRDFKAVESAVCNPHSANGQCPAPR